MSTTVLNQTLEHNISENIHWYRDYYTPNTEFTIMTINDETSHAFPFQFFKINFHITLPSITRSLKLSLLLKLCIQSSYSHTCHMSQPPYQFTAWHRLFGYVTFFTLTFNVTGSCVVQSPADDSLARIFTVLLSLSWQLLITLCEVQGHLQTAFLFTANHSRAESCCSWRWGNDDVTSVYMYVEYCTYNQDHGINCHTLSG